MKNFKKGFLASALAIVGLIGASQSAIAGTATATFQVTATVNSACVVSATNVAFGTITPAATGTSQATGTITSTCTKTTPYTLAISAGGSGSVAARTMAGTAGNTDVLAYNLYTSNTYATPWGETVGTNTVAAVGTGAAQTATIYGQLSLNQYLKPDTYTDNLTVTLAY